MMDEQWLSPREVEAYTGVSERTLRKWRKIKGRGPQGFRKVNGRDIRYPLSAVREWKDQQRGKVPAPSLPGAELARDASRDSRLTAGEVTPPADSAGQGDDGNLAQMAVQAAARDDARRAAEAAQRAADARRVDLDAVTTELRITVRNMLGVDIDGPPRFIMHAGQPSELDCEIQGMSFVWSVLDRALYHVSRPDDERFLILNKADLGRAIIEQERRNDDHLPLVGDLSAQFKASIGRAE